MRALVRGPSQRLSEGLLTHRTRELVTELGHGPLPVDISEFEKLEGCVTCLSGRLRRA